MPVGRTIRPFVLLGFLLGVLGASAGWFLFGATVRTEHPLRLVVGACMIFVLPGLTWGEVLRLRGRSPLETIALSFVLSAVVEIGLLAVVLPFGVGIAAWVGLLLTTTAAGVLVLVRRAVRGDRFRFAGALLTLPRGPLPDRVLHAACVLVPVLLMVPAYRWGENVADVGGEKYLHMTFVRYYAEMPLELPRLAIDRGLPPPNLIHFWEFLLAGWARCVRIDPLPLFCRARFVVPVLGLSGMYLLTRMVFVARKRTAAVFIGILLLCLSALVLNCGALQWVTSLDPTRRVCTFLGTGHHGDTAMDLLLALSAGVALLWMRRPSWASGLLLTGILATDFLWHPREFLQTAFYVGVFVLAALLLPSLRRAGVWKRCGGAVGVLVAVALLATAASTWLVGRASHGYDEMALKRKAVAYAFQGRQLRTVRSLFNYPMHFSLSSTGAPSEVLPSAEVIRISRREWHYDAWLFLAAGSLVVLSLLGNLRDRQLAFYHFLLWGVGLCWNASMLLTLALTYSEFFFTTPRLLYIFSYLVIADALVVAGGMALALCRRGCAVVRVPGLIAAGLAVIFAVAVLGGLGYVLRAWVRAGMPAAPTVAVWVSGASLLLLLLCLGGDRLRWPAVRGTTSLVVAAVLALVLVLPLTARDLKGFARLSFRQKAPEVPWFGAGNPFGYSPELLTWSRTLPPGRKLLSNPRQPGWLCVYAPVYLAIHPGGNVIRNQADRSSIDTGTHPFFGPRNSAQPGIGDTVDHEKALAWLEERHIDYVLIEREDYEAGLGDYFHRHPDRYTAVFDNPAGRESVFQVLYPQSGAGQED